MGRSARIKIVWQGGFRAEHSMVQFSFGVLFQYHRQLNARATNIVHFPNCFPSSQPQMKSPPPFLICQNAYIESNRLGEGLAKQILGFSKFLFAVAFCSDQQIQKRNAEITWIYK